MPHQKPRLKIKLSIYIGTILLISNTLLVMLLLYNLEVAFAGFLIPVNGEMVEYYFDDGFEARLLLIGVVIDLTATVFGTVFTYMVLNKVFRPLQKLSEHMLKVDRENAFSPIDLSSNAREIDSLITVFNTVNLKLYQKFEDQKQFSSFVAHEFRTPLAVMQTSIDVYKKRPQQSPEELVELVSQQVSKLSALVTQILKLSGIQRVELRERVPVNILLAEVMEDLEDFAESSQVELEDLTAGQSAQVIGSHDLLYQAFFNLVENGIKYNHAGGKVSASMYIQQGKVCVRIKNTGCTIPETVRDKIFLPFYRCEQKDGSKSKGYGIGLAFSRKVMEHHKGTLGLAEDSQDTCFEACLNEYDPEKE